MKLPADHLEALALICGDDQELADIRAVTEEWLERRYPGLTEAQRLGLTRAIFEEALRDMRRNIKGIVTSVPAQYGLSLQSRAPSTKRVAASSIAGG